MVTLQADQNGTQMTLMEPIFAASPFFLSASSHEISVIRMPFLCLRLLWRDGAASPTGQLQPEAQRQPPQLHLSLIHI